MTASPDRIASLDFLRGIAVMGILVANLPAFALPAAAYFAPAAWGGTTPADVVVWFATYVFVEGKMRGLFALLFGASLLLVIERAEAQGRNPAVVHYRRMAALFAIGCAHLYGLWWGDILAHYALCGAIAYPLVRLPTRGLVAIALMLILWQVAEDTGLYLALLDAQAHPGPRAARLLRSMAETFGTPPSERTAAELAAYRGSYSRVFAWRWQHASTPLDVLPSLAPETIATMVLGMVGLRSGFLTGGWSRRHYRWITLLLGPSLLIYAVAGLHTWRGGFALADVAFGSTTLSAILRWPAILGYAALGTLLMRPGGWLTTRIASAGRMALSNYIATSLVMTTIFYGYGLGLFGSVERAELYLLIPPAWAIMIAWSRRWLVRHRHGPAESLWRAIGRTPKRSPVAPGRPT